MYGLSDSEDHVHQCEPYLTAWLSVCLIAALCADGISGMTMWLGTFGAQFAAMPGVDPGALHRILVASSTTFDSLPHSPMLAQGMGVFKTDFKESYKYSFVLIGIIPGYFLTGRCDHRDYLLLRKEAAWLHGYDYLLKPLTVAGLTLKNRLLSAPTSMAELGAEEHYTDENFNYYRLRQQVALPW